MTKFIGAESSVFAEPNRTHVKGVIDLVSEELVKRVVIKLIEDDLIYDSPITFHRSIDCDYLKDGVKTQVVTVQAKVDDESKSCDEYCRDSFWY